ncbi:hypothetical protein PG996_004239 [Apiospora saccharicola]|uniref:F-box domain-containing protein n=1 Tax=Apiospora saccharicola TaxID=335842 RepID=A0ABR1W3K0_9PEZI
MIPYMTGLRDLHWDVSRHGMTEGVSKDLLEKLPPQLHLHMSFFHWYHTPAHGSAQFCRALARLVGNRNLYSLSLDISVEQSEECAETMPVLKDVLLSCPNLRRHPELRTRWCHSGRMAYPLTPMTSYAGLGFADGERPAAAWEELGLGEYMWHSMGSRGYPVDADCRFPRILFPKLVGLRELRLKHDWNQATYEEDVVACLGDIVSPLEVLGLPRLKDEQMRGEVTRWVGAIVRHGLTLRSLTMHTENWCSWRDPDRGMTAPVLELLLPNDEIASGLSRLEELSLDLAWDADDDGWPYRALDVIALFPKLRHVELWFRLRRGCLDDHPHLTIAAARHLAGYLHQRNPRLQRLVLRSGLGEWRSVQRTVGQERSVSRSELNWIDFNCVSYSCEFVMPPLTDADDESGILITCPELSRELNWRLRSLATLPTDENCGDDIDTRGQRLVATDLDEKALRLKVALDGPLSGAEWKAWCNQHTPDEGQVESDRHSSTPKKIVMVRPWRRRLRNFKEAMGWVKLVLKVLMDR